MAHSQAVEVLLRPAVGALHRRGLCGRRASVPGGPVVARAEPLLGLGSALAFLTFGAIRFRDAWAILRYRRNIRRLPRYVMTSRDVPVSQQRLFVGRGFRWDQRHTHRLMQTYRPEFRRYVEPTAIYRAARHFEERLGSRRTPVQAGEGPGLGQPAQPARPLPPVGGLPRLHGIEPHEVDVTCLPLAERVGHSLVLGTTRVSKTRLAELFITQDIRRKVGGQHEVVIVFDPRATPICSSACTWKPNAPDAKASSTSSIWAGRTSAPATTPWGGSGASAKSPRASRASSPVKAIRPPSGSSRGGLSTSSLVLWSSWGSGPDYLLIQRHVINIDALFIEYAQHYFARSEPKAWEVIVQLEAKLNDKNIPRNMIGREKRVVALEQYLSQVRIYDPVLDGLRSAVRYDRTYFDKIVASLLPLLEKLTTGKIAQLLAPNYSDLGDPRPIFDWMQIIRKRAVVYVGLDALSDAEVAAAVGNSMFSDLVSVAGHIYKFGIDDGLPGASAGVKVPINVHADEFNEADGRRVHSDGQQRRRRRGAGHGLYADHERHRGPHRQPRQGRPGHRELQ